MRTVAPSGMSATASIALWVIMTMAVPLRPEELAYAVQPRSRRGSGADVLEHDGEALPDTDADARHAPAPAGALEVAGEGAEDAAARGPEGVPDGDGATVPVDDLGVDRPGVEACERLGGEGLVEFDGGDVVPADAGPGEGGVGRLDGRVAEVLGLERARAATGDAGDRVEADLVAGGLAAEEDRRCAVVERRRVARRDGASFPPERRAQAGQPLRRGVGTDRLVPDEVDPGDGDDEVVVPAVVPGLVGEAVRPLGEGVLAFAGDTVLLAQLLGRLAERHGPLRRHGRIDQPPTERCGGEGEIACGVRLLGLGQDPGGAAHRLGPAADDDVGVAGLDRARGDHGRVEAGAAESVDRGAGDARRQTREQRGHARDVAVLLARPVGVAEHDLVDLLTETSLREAGRPGDD